MNSIIFWIFHASIFLPWYRIHFVNAKCKPPPFIFLQMEMDFKFLSLFFLFLSSPSPSFLNRGALKQVAFAVPLLVLSYNAGMLLQFRITKSHVGLVRENEECSTVIPWSAQWWYIECIYRTSVTLKFCGRWLRKICLKISPWWEEETLPLKGS